MSAGQRRSCRLRLPTEVHLPEVPRSTHTPPTLPGMLSTTGHSGLMDDFPAMTLLRAWRETPRIPEESIERRGVGTSVQVEWRRGNPPGKADD
jgi:hypothetical protein